MANVLAPFGFRDNRRVDGAAWTGAFQVRNILSTNTTPIFQGDPVVSLSSGYITQAAPGTTQIAGIFVGCEWISISQGRRVFSNFWPGADAVTTIPVVAKVIVDPNVVFVVQCNGGPVTIANIDNNINFAIGTGNTLNGLSGATVDFSTIATTATLPFRIVDYYRSIGNGGDATTAYNYALVAPNNWDFKSLTGI